MITIALSKGRIYDDTLPLLLGAGIEPTEDPGKSRKLIIPTNHDDVQLLILRASDVPTYVSLGAADLGIAGKDVLMEHDDARVYELVDLKIAQCKLMVAGKAGEQSKVPKRIATKYVHSARAYFEAKGLQVDVVKLYGSMEIAPLVNLADAIVDVVDTGNTLRANGLEPFEHIAHISSRLIVNQDAYKVKYARLHNVVQSFAAQVHESV